jgi:hypothetical protein
LSLLSVGESSEQAAKPKESAAITAILLKGKRINRPPLDEIEVKVLSQIFAKKQRLFSGIRICRILRTQSPGSKALSGFKPLDF